MADYMTRRIAKDMDYSVYKYLDGISTPDTFQDTVQVVAKKDAEKGLHGQADFNTQERPFAISVFNLWDCSFNEFAYEAVQKGQPGCPVCLVTQISVGSIAALHNLQTQRHEHTQRHNSVERLQN